MKKYRIRETVSVDLDCYVHQVEHKKHWWSKWVIVAVYLAKVDAERYVELHS